MFLSSKNEVKCGIVYIFQIWQTFASFRLIIAFKRQAQRSEYNNIPVKQTERVDLVGPGL